MGECKIIKNGSQFQVTKDKVLLWGVISLYINQSHGAKRRRKSLEAPKEILHFGIPKINGLLGPRSVTPKRSIPGFLLGEGWEGASPNVAQGQLLSLVFSLLFLTFPPAFFWCFCPCNFYLLCLDDEYILAR